MKSIHDFKIQNIEGETLDFSDFKGKKILVVNVASACGFTPQYQQLQELHENFSDKLVIVGMPCNDFGSQEADAFRRKAAIEGSVAYNSGVVSSVIPLFNVL